MGNKSSLRIRLTVLVGIIIISIAVLLTISSIGGAYHFFGETEMKKEILPYSDGVQKFNSINQDKESSSYEGNLSTNIKTKDAQKRFSLQLLVTMVVIIIIGIGFTYIVVGRVLMPLTNLTHAIQDISGHNLSKRIEVSQTNDEIEQLSKSFNSMLERLDKSFQSQKRFASNAAHELKTPLTIIKASINVLQLEDLPSIEEYKENVEITELSTKRLIKVVDDLLNLTTEGIDNYEEKISLQNIFKIIISDINNIAKERNITLKVLGDDSYICGNSTLLHRAFFNLIENAIKYGVNDGKINILLKKVNNDKISIVVSDNGVGIPNNEIPNIFEAFYRVDKSRSREIGGSGLGLSIVKAIIDKHNGSIVINSKINVGTQIEVMLPITKE